MRGLAFLSLLATAAAEITVDMKPQVLYGELSDKLRISGKGFKELGDKPELEFLPKMGLETYELTVVSDEVISLALKRAGGGPKTWPVPADPDAGSQTIYLLSLKKQGSTENELADPVPVAECTAAPSVMRGGDKVIYMTGTKKFNINGTGFRAKDVKLAFDPPLVQGEDYILEVRSSTFMQLTLRTGKKWRSDGEPGPLKLRRISTGAGFLRIDAKYGGVTVAEVQVDLGAHGVRVETTYSDQKIYQSSPTVKVSGSGFNATTSLNALKWGNSLRGKGINYTIVSGSTSSLELRLAEFSKWRSNPKNLPSPLLLLAVNAGAGLVPVGPTEAKKGRRVATVYEDPGVQSAKASDLPTLYRTHSHELWVRGQGFTKGTTALTFEPALKLNDDYVLTVFNRTALLVTLLDGKAWAPKAGTLAIAKIDTGAGTVGARYALTRGKDDLAMSVPVASVVDDEDAHASGLYVDRTAGQTIYQSGAVKHLAINGGGLCPKGVAPEPKLVFDPPLPESAYSIFKATPTEMQLERAPEAKWRDTAGALKLVSLTCGGQETVTFAGGEGIAVATILANPTVEASPDRSVYSSLTKRLTIRGTGFALYSDASLTLEPTRADDYVVASVLSTSVVLELKEGKSWVPPALVADGATPELRVIKVNTGAGMINVNGREGVVVAKVLKDADGAICDDSCDFANDGVCDDGTLSGLDAGVFDRESPYGYFYEGGWYYGGFGDFDDDFHEYDDDYYGYDHLYAYDDAYGYAPFNGASKATVCEVGTDCTDCAAAVVKGLSNGRCDNTCVWALDGSCDDDRTDGPCVAGTDCGDCGPIGASNFTALGDDDAWWDDDEAYWDDDYEWDDGYREWADLKYDDDDAAPIAIIRSLPHPSEAKEPRVVGEPGAGGVFVVLLQSVVYLTGALFLCSGIAYLIAQRNAGKDIWQAVPTLEPTDFEPKKAGAAVELTPDVSYSGK